MSIWMERCDNLTAFDEKILKVDGHDHHLFEYYRGCVISEFERNGYDDSDFVAVVWDESTQTIQDITYATTRFWTYCNSCTIDATPEVLTKVKAYNAEQERIRHAAFVERDILVVREGREVEVFKGRKVPIGTIGRVSKILEGPWGKTVNILVGRNFFNTSIDNVRVHNSEQYRSEYNS